MKVDRSKLKKTPTEAVSVPRPLISLIQQVHWCVCALAVATPQSFAYPDSPLLLCSPSQPADCRTLIERLKGCSDEQLLLELQQIKTWNIGKVSVPAPVFG